MTTDGANNVKDVDEVLRSGDFEDVDAKQLQTGHNVLHVETGKRQ